MLFSLHISTKSRKVTKNISHAQARTYIFIKKVHSSSKMTYFVRILLLLSKKYCNFVTKLVVLCTNY